MISDPKYVNDAGDIEVAIDGSPLLVSPLQEGQQDFPLGADVWHSDAQGYLLEADGTRKLIGGQERRPEDLSDGVLRMHGIPATAKLVHASAAAGVYGEIAAYVPPDPPPPYPTAQAARAAVHELHEAFLAAFIDGYSVGEYLSWDRKAQAAAAYLADTATAAQETAIETEASLAEMTPGDLCDLILAKELVFVDLSAMIAGLRKRAQTQIAAGEDPADFAAAVAQAATDLETEKTSRGL